MIIQILNKIIPRSKHQCKHTNFFNLLLQVDKRSKKKKKCRIKNIKKKRCWHVLLAQSKEWKTEKMPRVGLPIQKTPSKAWLHRYYPTLPPTPPPPTLLSLCIYRGYMYIYIRARICIGFIMEFRQSCIFFFFCFFLSVSFILLLEHKNKNKNKNRNRNRKVHPFATLFLLLHAKRGPPHAFFCGAHFRMWNFISIELIYSMKTISTN